MGVSQAARLAQESAASNTHVHLPEATPEPDDATPEPEDETAEDPEVDSPTLSSPIEMCHLANSLNLYEDEDEPAPHDDPEQVFPTSLPLFIHHRSHRNVG